MSRPRKPFGANHPGRLPATMMKVLAAEVSDPQRLRKGKQYAKDGSVLDIVVEPGVVTCEVQGTRPTPYVAAVEVTRGDGMPLRRDLGFTCTCPDADNWDDHACKHVLATMFVFSDELLLEPELLDVWRGRDAGAVTDEPHEPVADAEPDDRTASPPASPSHRHLRVVRDHERAPAGPVDEAADAGPDPLDDLLSIPAGATLPDLPPLEPVEPDLPRRPALAAVLSDALRHTRVDWD